MDLIDDFTAAVEKLGDEEGFFDEAGWENLGLNDWMDEEGEETQETAAKAKRRAETTELLQDEVTGITLILGVTLIASIAIVGGVCYFLREEEEREKED